MSGKSKKRREAKEASVEKKEAGPGKHAAMKQDKKAIQKVIKGIGTPQGQPAAPAFPDIGVGRVVIEAVTPELDGGRHPVKVVVGDIAGRGERRYLHRRARESSVATCYGDLPRTRPSGTRVPMAFRRQRSLDARRFVARRAISRHHYTIEGWRDPFASLLDGIVKKRAAGVTVWLVEAGEAVALIADADAARHPIFASPRRCCSKRGSRRRMPGSAAQIDLIVDE